MKYNPLYILFSFLILMSACKTKDIAKLDEIPAGVVYFEQTDLLGNVLDKAAEQDKLVFIDFYADWCMPCKLMDEDVFTDKPIADFMNENFINYKIDAEKGHGPDLAQLYQIQAYPTLLFMDSKGKVLVRKIGAAYHTELRKLANEALSLKG